MSAAMKQRQLFEVTRTDWETPQDLFDKLNTEFEFQLDVAASEENAKCERFFDRMADAFRFEWAPFRCWMNPPYGTEIGRWIRKAHEESERGAVVVGLLPARTDTAWWHDHIIGANAEVRFLRGRLKFGGSKNSAPFPSAVVVWS